MGIEKFSAKDAPQQENIPQKEAGATHPENITPSELLNLEQSALAHIEGRTNNADRMVMSLPEEARKTFSERIETLGKESRAFVREIAGLGAFAIALNATPAFGEEESGSKQANEATAVHALQNQGIEGAGAAKVILESASTVVSAGLKGKIDAIEAAGKKLITSTEAGNVIEGADNALTIAAEIPPSLLGKTGPVLSAISEIRSLHTEIKEQEKAGKEVEASFILKKIARFLINIKTLGFGGIALDMLQALSATKQPQEAGATPKTDASTEKPPQPLGIEKVPGTEPLIVQETPEKMEALRNKYRVE